MAGDYKNSPLAKEARRLAANFNAETQRTRRGAEIKFSSDLCVLRVSALKSGARLGQ